MFKNYFKIAWRHIVKRPFYSTVNIMGLAIGILFALLISAYVWTELQVNKNLRNAKNQYFLKSEWKDPNLGVEIITLGPLSRRLKEDYPNLVANYYRWDGITSVVSKGEKYFREGIQLGDSTLLSMFGFELMQGDSKTALNNPYSVVLTRDKAIKYFGKTNVIGETITIQSFSGTKRDFQITGVLKKIPENSVTHINDANNNGIFIPTNTFSYFGRSDFEAWTNIIIPSYIEVRNGVSSKDLEGPIKKLILQNAPDGIRQNLNIKAVPLTEYYLQKDNALVKRMLYALSFVGLFILLMAIVNFVNISISSSAVRTREIGVRKVLGSAKTQIVFQFLVESVILVSLATVIAVVAYPFAKDLFAQLIGKEIPSLLFFPLYFIFIPVAAVLCIGIMAGFYPAFILSSLKSVDSLKGKLKTVKENILLRKSLIGFQFCIACIVIIAAFIVTQQISHFFSQSLGYNKEYIVSSQVPRDWSPAGEREMETIRNEFAILPQISQATLSYEIPDGNNGGQPPVYRLGTDSTGAIAMQSLVTDGNYLTTYQIPMKAGSFFSRDQVDSSKVILNETAVKALGWTNAEEAIGQQVRIPNSPSIYTVQGVTSDFHFSSMQQKIQPGIFFSVRLTNTYRYLSFKIKPGNISNAIAAIQKRWSILLPGSSFEYRFMDETLKNLYKNEIQLKKASYAATFLSLVIVLLGTLGLISLSLQKRTKELGIRKVLGASVPGMVVLFLKEFLWVIIVAGIIASPIAYVIMNGWLNDYVYRITITPTPFIFSLGLMTLMTILLIGAQTIKAANDNPVKSLRTE
ncbi:MAG: FtsX-like permease family protein [Bacteroidetes bacterium]|nr:MAG: FtsX-like permease family protein [Bacteroidota bacterium]